MTAKRHRKLDNMLGVASLIWFCFVLLIGGLLHGWEQAVVVLGVVYILSYWRSAEWRAKRQEGANAPQQLVLFPRNP